MKRSSLILIPVLFFAIHCSSPKPVESANQNTGMSIKNQLQNGALLVDVRTPEEFAAGSVKGAVNIPLDQVESRISEFEGKPSVIVFCKTGNRSGEAKEILENSGIEKVTNGINVKTMEEEMK